MADNEERTPLIDGMGDRFYNKLKDLHQLTADLFEFLFERKELYAICLYLLLDKGIYECTIQIEDIESLFNYMLYVQPSEDKKSILVKVIPPTGIPLKED